MRKAADLFCGAGGAGKGLQLADYEVHGWDIAPMPRYPGCFNLGNALDADLSGFDFVWASPPCQRHTQLRRTVKREYECFIAQTREKLQRWGGPYIIENVVGAPLKNPVMLCGLMFGMPLYRHRIFESNQSLITPAHVRHQTPASKAGHYEKGTIISVAGNCAPIMLARAAMGIAWMTRSELAEAIPPAFSHYLARQIQ